MEIYSLIALVIIYVLTAILLKKYTMRKLWFLALLAVFITMAFSLGFLRLTNQEVMMNPTQLGWYYTLYIFASLNIVLGIINAWIFRKEIFDIVFEKPIRGDCKDIADNESKKANS